MLRFLSRVALIAVSSSVVIPYTAAMLCHFLYSHHPLRPRTVVRTLHPKRVYALSVVLLQKLVLITRYVPLYLEWRQYYYTADPSMTLKNLAFGRNSCCLDLHLPPSHRVTKPLSKPEPKPVIMFVYGGAWSSGDKLMYGALCAQLVHRMDVLVCCPNYSHYPKGCVDDMIQDIVDCIQWIYDNIHDYGGDRDRLMLIGHSAGAHLCTMALLELLHDQRQHAGPFPPDTSTSGMLFHESHYGRLLSDPGAKDPLEDSSGSSESFAVVSESGNDNGESQITSLASSFASTTTSMVEVSHEDASLKTSQAEEPASTEPAQGTPVQGAEGGDTGQQEGGDVKDGAGVKQTRQDSGEGEDESAEEEDDNDSIVTVRPKDIERHPTLIDLAHSIKAFVGLAGVYHIGDHYKHETWRGVELLSGMAPAMYGPDHFERFSPSTILLSLDAPISLPKIVLVHGTADYVVPVFSSQKMADSLARVFADVSLRIIPDCDHFDICFDLMRPSRHFHSSLMTLLYETASSVF